MLPRCYRMSLFAALLPVCIAYGNPSREDDLGGVWVGWQCPANVQPDMRQCAHFMLELHQRDGRLCGAHTFATPGAANMDEGRAPSIRGDVSGGTVQAIAVSGRAPMQIRVAMHKEGKALIWQRLESPTGDYLLPLRIRLLRANRKTLFAPVFAQELHASCDMVFDTAQAAASDRR